MARHGMRGVVVCLAFWGWVGLGLNAAELANPGFEAGSATEVSGWSVPPYWSGSMAPTAVPEERHAGRRGLRLAAAEKAGQWWGRVLGTPQATASLGQPNRFSVWAKGQGSLRLGVIRYRQPPPGETPYVYLWQEPVVPLTPDWQLVSFDFTIAEPEFTKLAFCIEVQGVDAVAFLDDVSVASLVPPGVTLAVRPSHPMLAAGTSCELRVRLSGTAPEGPVRVYAFPPAGGTQRQEAALDAAGEAVVRLPTDAAATGLWRLLATHPGSGAVGEVWADVLPADDYAAFERAAAGMRLPEGRLHLLVLGDSLSDFSRGSNYVDKLAVWLDRLGGSRCTVRNAGVGGDDITRVWARLNGEPKTHRLAMYDGLLEPMPTHILIFLGHNDSKVSSGSEYQKTAVAPEVFASTYRQVLDKLKADTGAALIVLSSSSSSYEITSANAERSRAAGRAHSLFGKPELMEQFNDLTQAAATAAGAAYLDLYTPMRAVPDKDRLVTADGVHLSAEGHRYVARFLLERLFR